MWALMWLFLAQKLLRDRAAKANFIILSSCRECYLNVLSEVVCLVKLDLYLVLNFLKVVVYMSDKYRLHLHGPLFRNVNHFIAGSFQHPVHHRQPNESLFVSARLPGSDPRFGRQGHAASAKKSWAAFSKSFSSNRSKALTLLPVCSPFRSYSFGFPVPHLPGRRAG